MIQHFDHGDLGAHGGVVGDHFQSDDAAADDDELLRHFGKLKNLAVGDNEAAQVFPDAGQRGNHGGGAGGDDHLRALVILSARGHAEAAGHAALDDGVLLDDGDLSAAHLRADAGDQCLDHLAPAGDDGLLVNGDAFGLHAVGFAVQGVFVELGGIQKRLGGDAALVQANAAQGVLFKQDDLEPRVTGALSRQITGGAAADDDKIKHRYYPFL